MGRSNLVAAFLLAFGPAAVLLTTVIARRPFLVLVTVAGAATYLLSLLVAALPATALGASASAGELFGVLLFSLAVQEGLARPACLLAIRRGSAVLDSHAAELGLRGVTRLDALSLALALGLGHGLAHAALFALPVLALAGAPQVLYRDACPQLSLTASTALSSSTLLVLHSAAMVCAWHGYATRQRALLLTAPALHVAVSLLSLSSLQPGGCVATAALSLLAALVQAVLAWRALLATVDGRVHAA